MKNKKKKSLITLKIMGMSAGHNKLINIWVFSRVKIRSYRYQLRIGNDVIQLKQLVTHEANPTPPMTTDFREHISSLITKIQF